MTTIVRSSGAGGGSGGGFAPQTLTASGGVITPNAALGYGPHRYTATGNVTLGAPTGGTNGEPIEVQVTASGGDRQLTIGGTAVAIPSGATWWGHFSYDSGLDRWHLDDPGAGGGVSGYTDEQVRDTMAAALVAGSNVTITPNDAGDTITIAAATTGSSGIPAATVTAKGDLIGGIGNATVARLAVGADGLALVASSGATTGLAYAAPTPAAHTHAAADLTSGTVATARLGSGTASSTTFLRGDQTWATPAGGSSVDLADTPDLTRAVAYTSTSQTRPQWRGPVIWQGDVTTLGLPTNAIPGKDWTQDFGARTDGARYFDGASPNYAFAADSTALRSPVSAVTLAGFWRPSVYTATDGGLFGKTGNLAGRSMSYAVIRRDTTDARNLRFRLGLSTAGNVLIDPGSMTTALSMDTWYFVACTWSSGTAPRMRVWTTGGTSLIDSTGGTSYTDSIVYGADPFRVGKNDQTDTTGMHRVSLSAIGVHNAVLSDANLTSWRTNKVPPVTLSGGFWALNGTSTTSEPDTAQTNHLTLSGIVHTTGGP